MTSTIEKKRFKETILNAYQFRHACKEFDVNKSINLEDFHFILETGRLSPSSFGFEPWKFIVVQNSEIREKLKPISWGAQKQLSTASHFVIILSRKRKDMIYDSEFIDNMMRTIQKLPDEVVEGKRSAYQKFQQSDFELLENDRVLFEWSCRQTYIALGNMMTAAAQIGIDSCPIEGFNKREVEELLTKEELMNENNFGVSCMVAFGYRLDDPRSKTRQEMDNVVEWVN